MNTSRIGELRVWKQSPYADNLLTSYCIHRRKVNKIRATNKSALKSYYAQINKMKVEFEEMLSLNYT